LHRREAEGAGHVAVGQGTAATWPAQSQCSRSDSAEQGHSTPKRGKAATLHPKTVTFVTGAKSDFFKWRRHSRSVLRYASAYSSFLQTQREYSCGCALSFACSPSSSLPPRVPPSRRKSTWLPRCYPAHSIPGPCRR